MLLTINKLVDENYPSWAMYMQVYLIKQDTWNIVSGNTTQPTGSPNSKAVQSWQKKHDLAAVDILLNVSTITSHIVILPMPLVLGTNSNSYSAQKVTAQSHPSAVNSIQCVMKVTPCVIG